MAMEYTTRRWLGALAAIVLLSCAPAPAAAAGRKLLQIQISLAQQFVVPQNHMRAIQEQRPLKWSSGLADQAERWAARFKGNCAAASAAMPGGVNVFRGFGEAGKAWQPSDAVAAWAEQSNYFDLASGACAAGKLCAQFKQVMSKGNTDVGCASVKCADGTTLMTCHYSPLGNVFGERPF
ncbi:pathogenesis-related protein PRMS-like [Triticum urartu]|uniref:SCP domain-containing protein n=1 Tax=Triticum urartu TaxID=4572 RepID=A0A8R7QVM7_TRIUA|nr:pathogenesis-related protein PRMS-like [Triticum urartu]